MPEQYIRERKQQKRTREKQTDQVRTTLGQDFRYWGVDYHI